MYSLSLLFTSMRVSREFSFIILGIGFLAGLFVIGFSWIAVDTAIDLLAGNILSSGVLPTGPTSTYPNASLATQKPAKQTVKGLYLTAYSAGSSGKLDSIIRLIDETELNAVVVDIKDYSGYILFDTKVSLAKQMNLVDNRYPSLTSTIKKLHDHGIYVIARQTVFQDPILAKAKPEWSVKSKTGGLWRDYKGISWVDPTRKEIWEYNTAIAKDAISYGFDEINFDYVRFPSDGKISDMVYSGSENSTNTKKYRTMQKFYNYLSDQLKNEPAWISLDMFGFVMDKSGEDDMNIGQRLEDGIAAADYVCPMMYPSHYPAGYLGLKNPANSPGVVLGHGLKISSPRFEGARAELRPWIQAFNLGAVYDADMIRTQIDEVEKYTSAGWLLWNAANRYTDAGLKHE